FFEILLMNQSYQTKTLPLSRILVCTFVYTFWVVWWKVLEPDLSK
ncbi:MAG: hypothetical protein ACI88L_000406, partial [Candidatus Paceibacteria bacterium]